MTARRRAAIVVAGGTGDRFGRPGGKQLAPLAGLPAVAWSLLAIDESLAVGLIVLVCAPGRLSEYRERAVDPLSLNASVMLAEGGGTRRLSVAAGLAVVPEDVTTILVHDGARPLATADTFSAAIIALEESAIDGVVVGHPSVDTLKIVEEQRVLETPDRSRFWAAQTPQVFRAGVLRSAHTMAARDDFEGTDDASLVERAGGSVMMLEGPRDNIKLTLPEDAAYAELVLTRRGRGGL